VQKNFCETKSDDGASVGHRYDTLVCEFLVLQKVLSLGRNINFKLAHQIL